MLNSYTFTDEELLYGLSQREESALQVLFNTYYPVLCRFAEKYLPDASLAKDIVQETFIKLWRSNRAFNSTDALKAFLYTVTRNACLNLVRGRERLHNKHEHAAADTPEASAGAWADIVLAESVALIYKEVQAMPAKMQEIFLLSYREGMPVREIAQQLNMNVKAVKKQKYKALVLLRGKFNKGSQPLAVLLTLLFP